MTNPDDQGPDLGREVSFGDALRSLFRPDSGGGKRRREEETDPGLVVPGSPPDQPAGGGSRPAQQPADPDTQGSEWDEPEDFSSVVRPYAWTKGRTKSTYNLAVETLVSTNRQADPARQRDVSLEHRSVAEMCVQPRSVAEVAARLSLPLGVARVLLGDMAETGAIVVHRTASESGEAPDVALMERVLSGLRRL